MLYKIFIALIVGFVTFFVHSQENSLSPIIVLQGEVSDPNPLYTIDRDIELTLYNKGAYVSEMYITYTAANGKLMQVSRNNILLWQKRTIKIPKGSSYINVFVSLVTVDCFPRISLEHKLIFKKVITSELLYSIGLPNEVIFHIWGTNAHPKWKLMG